MTRARGPLARALMPVLAFVLAWAASSQRQEGDAGARPSPLTAREEALPELKDLVRRFNPAMALPDAEGPWPVDVAYTWSLGADLMARTIGDAGDTPGAQARADRVAVPGARLGDTSWADLPARDARGRRIEYWLDSPGDDRIAADGRTGWRRRWRALAGADAAHSPFPPTQYAHAVWLDRARGRLAIQYWFFFPFNEWINHHEGDWEHIQVVLEGPREIGASGSFRPIGYEFFFHGWRYQPPRTLRVGGDAGSHPIVFTGGRGRWLLWGGAQSGASYPLPARYPGAGGGIGPLRPADDARHPRLYLPAEAFRVVLLPEPDRLDARAHPELSWLRLPFYAGAPRARINPPLTDALGGGGAPLQPARRPDWSATAHHPVWTGTPELDGPLDEQLPLAWRGLPSLPSPGRSIGTSPDGTPVARR